MFSMVSGQSSFRFLGACYRGLDACIVYGPRFLALFCMDFLKWTSKLYWQFFSPLHSMMSILNPYPHFFHLLSHWLSHVSSTDHIGVIQALNPQLCSEGIVRTLVWVGAEVILFGFPFH